MVSVAFLGPTGTYTQQAAYQHFKDVADYHEKQTILDVFESLSEVDFGVVPQENSIYGIVTETYDSLACENAYVCGDIVLRVEHCLVLRKDTILADVECVMSHEQALGQCRNFLRAFLPAASLQRFPSTAAAVRALLSTTKPSAAIASKQAASQFPELRIAKEGIQDSNNNYTRFYVLSRCPPPSTTSVSLKFGLIRAMLTMPRDDATAVPALTSIFAALDLDLTRVDRRPSRNGPPFTSIYFLEVSNSIRECPDCHHRGCSTHWEAALEASLQRVRVIGVEPRVIGVW